MYKSIAQKDAFDFHNFMTFLLKKNVLSFAHSLSPFLKTIFTFQLLFSTKTYIASNPPSQNIVLQKIFWHNLCLNCRFLFYGTCVYIFLQLCSDWAWIHFIVNKLNMHPTQSLKWITSPRTIILMSFFGNNQPQHFHRISICDSLHKKNTLQIGVFL